MKLKGLHLIVILGVLGVALLAHQALRRGIIMTESSQKQPALFFSHGGGPMFLMTVPEGDPGKGLDSTSPAAQKIKLYFEKKFAGKTKPSAILVVSAHWEGSNDLEILVKDPPSLFFDYYGFPPETYKYKYPCRHSPALTDKIVQLFEKAGLKYSKNTSRGLDHGVFIPLMLLLPEANIPVVQLSLHGSLDPSLHFRIGQILSPLRSQGVFILGSGMATHNMGHGLERTDSKPVSWAKAFQDWLDETLLRSTSEQRAERLTNWDKSAPNARKAHPREEHFMPLHVIAGAAGEDKLVKEWEGWAGGHFSLASYGTKD